MAQSHVFCYLTLTLSLSVCLSLSPLSPGLTPPTAIVNVQDDSSMWNILTLVRNQQMVYDICIKELARQVSVQCRERGELLNKICTAYGALFSKLPSYFAAAESSTQAVRARIAELELELAEERAKVPM